MISIPLETLAALFLNNLGGKPMFLDAHIHMEQPCVNIDTQHSLCSKMKLAGIDGGVIMSPDPVKYSFVAAEKRIDAAIELCRGMDMLFPFYWIDPMDDSAVLQVDMAAKRGIVGFKIICSGFYPNDNRVLDVCERAASLGKPVIFHSGILWDGRDSSRYNRPCEFECLLDIKDLRFSLAHISWPWCDECIAVYGKFANACALRGDITSEMFVDITPGTPKMWRPDAMRKLLCGGYDVMHNILFGSDCNVENYNWEWANDWIKYDIGLIENFEIENREALIRHIFGQNLLRFIGISDKHVERVLPITAV